MKRTSLAFTPFIILFCFSVLFGLSLSLIMLSAFTPVSGTLWLVLFGFSLFLCLQGSFTFYLMSYAWNDPQHIDQLESPKEFESPTYSFTAIIPIRQEEKVIADTIRAVANLSYPKHLCQTLLVVHEDDVQTLKIIEKTLKIIKDRSIQLVVSHDTQQSKPHSLNIGLLSAKGDIVAVFDAEDEPHQDIYNIVNTLFVRENIDGVQSGVQLMNYASRWFSWLNVLEYYFWFKSFLPFFSKIQLIPLGGNTVFIKRRWLKKIHGWDEECLTEDADVGIRLSSLGAKIRVVYDEAHVTREETPLELKTFITQRTRWNQGFLQVFFKGDWLALPHLHQRILAVFILIWPLIQAFLLLYLPLVFFFLLQQKVPILLALFSTLPMYLLFLQLSALTVGMFEFSKKFGIPFSLRTPIMLVLTFFPYQIVLGVSALRAFYRLFQNKGSWEKTDHNNAHRSVIIRLPKLNYAK